MSQNRQGLSWSREEVASKLHGVMRGIYLASMACAKEYNTDISSGANIAGFLKVADAMREAAAGGRAPRSGATPIH